jgi:plasmid stabilization system protein ParE
MRVEFSPAAQFDLIEIASYIARDNPARAYSYVDELEATCQNLSDHPELGPARSRHIGSTLDAFFAAEGILEDVQTQAVKEVVAWQLTQSMQARKLSKAKLAALLETQQL